MTNFRILFDPHYHLNTNQQVRLLRVGGIRHRVRPKFAPPPPYQSNYAASGKEPPIYPQETPKTKRVPAHLNC